MVARCASHVSTLRRQCWSALKISIWSGFGLGLGLELGLGLG